MDEEDVEKDLNRDLCSLKAVLESDEEVSDENECGVEQEKEEVHVVSVLDKLLSCRERNLKLQENLTHLLRVIKAALATNKTSQQRLDHLAKSNFQRFPRASIGSYLKSWKPSKSKIPYFVDYKMEVPPPNQDTLSLERSVTVPNFYMITNDWLTGDVVKLKQGVKQKNIELLSEPIRKEMSQPGITVTQLKALQLEIRELRHLYDEKKLSEYSPDIDWDALAYEQFGKEKMGADCRLRYKNHDQPMIFRGAWKREEEKHLIKLVKENKARDWEKIASELGTKRTGIQCISHYQKALNPDLLNRKWTHEEDKKMMEGIRLYGNYWGLIGSYMGNRTGVQCANRNHASSNKERKTGRWDDDEDKRLHEAIEMYGDEGVVWARIAGHVGTRTSTQCRERWRSAVLGKSLLRPWSEEESKKIMDYAKRQLDNGEPMHWTEIGQEMNRKDDDCRREWRKRASKDELMAYQKLLVKSRSCLKNKRVTSRKFNAQDDPSVQPKDIEDDMMSDSAKQELTAYEERLEKREKRKTDKPVPKPKPPPKRRRKSRTHPPLETTVDPLESLQRAAFSTQSVSNSVLQTSTVTTANSTASVSVSNSTHTTCTSNNITWNSMGGLYYRPPSIPSGPPYMYYSPPSMPQSTNSNPFAYTRFPNMAQTFPQIPLEQFIQAMGGASPTTVPRAQPFVFPFFPSMTGTTNNSINMDSNTSVRAALSSLPIVVPLHPAFISSLSGNQQRFTVTTRPSLNVPPITNPQCSLASVSSNSSTVAASSNEQPSLDEDESSALHLLASVSAQTNVIPISTSQDSIDKTTSESCNSGTSICTGNEQSGISTESLMTTCSSMPPQST